VSAGIRRDDNGHRVALFMPMTVKSLDTDHRNQRESPDKKQHETNHTKRDRRSLRGQQTDEHTMDGAACSVAEYLSPIFKTLRKHI
jgi:hypothetical protein